jgi:TetR/AcrR family transcriptional repressor of nem operon
MPAETRQILLAAATARFREAGYVASSVEDICNAAGVSKGAFFHHFKSKEDLALAALEQWKNAACSIGREARFHTLENPTEKLLAALDFFIEFFGSQKALTACLAGITAQEVADTHPNLRDAANACFMAGADRFEPLLAAAAKHENKKLDARSLATLFVTTLQGSLLLARAAQRPALIADSLRHYRAYVAALLSPGRTSKSRAT